MDWQDAVGVIGGLTGLTLGLIALWDRTIGARRLAVRHVTAHTHRRDGRHANGEADVGGIDVVISNDGRLPVNLSRVWFGASRDATRFLGADEEWHNVDELARGRDIAPAEFDLVLDKFDRRIPPGESLTIHVEDWVSGGVPVGREAAQWHLEQGYRHVLRPIPQSPDVVRAIVGQPWLLQGDLGVGVEIVDYNGVRWTKVGLDYWRAKGYARAPLRDRWMRWLERWPSFMWVEPRLISWAVAGAATHRRWGWVRAAVVSAVIGWRIGPGVDTRPYPFLPKIWAWGELAELSQDPSQSRRQADLCREVYRSTKKHLGRPPTRHEFHEALDSRSAN